MSTDPADAVREALDESLQFVRTALDRREWRHLDDVEAHIAALTARVAELETRAICAEDSAKRWQGLQESTQALLDLSAQSDARRDRLAALAGAAPVAWLYECPHDGESDHYLSCARFLPSWVEAKGAKETPLFPHAPAKAREVSEADVRRSAVAYDAVTSRLDDPCSFTGMRAALATFAEGE